MDFPAMASVMGIQSIRMKVVLQRVSKASCTVEGQVTGAIETGFCAFIGFKQGDTSACFEKMADKIVALRVFNDENGKMNKSILEVGGKILSISQFTLYASCRGGRRPSFGLAASAEQAKRLYEQFNSTLAKRIKVETGIFQADMDIALINDGPVTILLDEQELFG